MYVCLYSYNGYIYIFAQDNRQSHTYSTACSLTLRFHVTYNLTYNTTLHTHYCHMTYKYARHYISRKDVVATLCSYNYHISSPYENELEPKLTL